MGGALAFANMASVIVGAILLPIVGWVLDNNVNLSYSDKIVPIYLPEAFKYAFSPLILGLLVGILFALKIKEPKIIHH